MGWGILAGSAVDAYNKQKQLEREAQWRDMQMRQMQREEDQQRALDDAMKSGATEAGQQEKGSVISPDLLKQTMPGMDDASAQALAQQLDSADPQQATMLLQQARSKFAQPAPQQPQQPQAPAVMPRTSTFGDQGQALPISTAGNEPYAPQAPAAPAPAPAQAAPQMPTAQLRAYRGHDGKTYMTAGADRPPRQSEILMAQSAKLLSGTAGYKGVQAGVMLRQQATEMMRQEQQKELNDIMTGNMSFDDKVGALLQMVNGSPVVPGSVDIETTKDGKINLIHNVPGHKGQFKFKLEGGSEDEVLGNLAMRVMAMTNPDVMVKRLEMDLAQRKVSNEETRTELDRQQGIDMRDYRTAEIGVRNKEIASREKIAGMEVNARAADRAESRAMRVANTPAAQKQQEIEFIAKSMVATGEEPDYAKAVRKATLQVIHPPKDQVQQPPRVNADGSLSQIGPDGKWHNYVDNGKGVMVERVMADDVLGNIAKDAKSGGKLFGDAPAKAGIPVAAPRAPAGPGRMHTGAYVTGADLDVKKNAQSQLAEGQQEYAIAQQRMAMAARLPEGPSRVTATMQAKGDMTRAAAKIQAAQQALAQ